MKHLAWMFVLVACSAPGPSPVLRGQVLAVAAHVTVSKSTGSFPEYRDVVTSAMQLDPVVIAAVPFAFAEAHPTSGGPAIRLKGIDPAQITKVLDLERFMTVGSLKELASVEGVPSIVLGDALMTSMHAQVGARIELTVGATPSVFRIVGVFHIGLAAYDGRLAFTSFSALQQLLGHGDEAHGVDLRLADVARSAEIVERLNQRIGGPPYLATDWSQLNRDVLESDRH